MINFDSVKKKKLFEYAYKIIFKDRKLCNYYTSRLNDRNLKNNKNCSIVRINLNDKIKHESRNKYE